MYLLDTNHFSRLLTGNSQLAERLESAGRAKFAICPIIQGEMTFMVLRSSQREENEEKLARLLSRTPIHPIDSHIAEAYADLRHRLFLRFAPHSARRRQKLTVERIGFDENDLWIAATALSLGLTVLTEDSDFARMTEAVPSLRHENWLA